MYIQTKILKSSVFFIMMINQQLVIFYTDLKLSDVIEA